MSFKTSLSKNITFLEKKKENKKKKIFGPIVHFLTNKGLRDRFGFRYWNRLDCKSRFGASLGTRDAKWDKSRKFRQKGKASWELTAISFLALNNSLLKSPIKWPLGLLWASTVNSSVFWLKCKNYKLYYIFTVSEQYSNDQNIKRGKMRKVTEVLLAKTLCFCSLVKTFVDLQADNAYFWHLCSFWNFVL